MQNACFPEMLQRQVAEIFIMYISVDSQNLNTRFLKLLLFSEISQYLYTGFIASAVTLPRCHMCYDLPGAERDGLTYQN